MNIFFLHFDVDTCARYHTNRHVVKMLLETCQLLSSVWWMTAPDQKVRYKLSHKNHPSSVWARQSVRNYLWLLELGFALAREYRFRYEKKHKCELVLYELRDMPLPPLPQCAFTPPTPAMPTEYKAASSCEAYQIYYKQEKRHLFSWKRRDMPDFLKMPFHAELLKRVRAE